MITHSPQAFRACSLWVVNCVGKKDGDGGYTARPDPTNGVIFQFSATLLNERTQELIEVLEKRKPAALEKAIETVRSRGSEDGAAGSSTMTAWVPQGFSFKNLGDEDEDED